MATGAAIYHSRSQDERRQLLSPVLGGAQRIQCRRFGISPERHVQLYRDDWRAHVLGARRHQERISEDTGPLVQA